MAELLDRYHRRLGLTRLDADRKQAALRQAAVQSGGQRARFQADPFHRHPARGEERNQLLRLACHARFAHKAAGIIDDADSSLFQRHVQPGKVTHGCSSSMLVADPHTGTRSTILRGAATGTTGQGPQSPHPLGKLAIVTAGWIRRSRIDLNGWWTISWFGRQQLSPGMIGVDKDTRAT
jgi:hypothetical protein